MKLINGAITAVLISIATAQASEFRKFNDVLYDVSAQLTPVTKESNRKDHFYRPESDQTVLYDPWLEYYFSEGTFPCAPDGAKELTSTEDKQRYFESNCPMTLFAHSPQGVEQVTNIKLNVTEKDVCGTISPVVTAKHDPINSEAYFISTMGKVGSKTFLPAKSLIHEKPTFFNAHRSKIPADVKDANIAFYRYPRKGNSEFIVVAKRQVTVPSEEGDHEQAWYGIYLLNDKNMQPLLPDDISMQSFYGEDLEMFGVEDFNGDGELDIILGKTPTMFLERYGTGFRVWIFAFPPSGGC